MSTNSFDRLFSFMRDAEARGYTVSRPSDLPKDIIEDPTILLCKAALESKFKDRKFLKDEVRQLLKDEYNYPDKDEDVIPQWYKDKWL